jgi:hypothetical protein
MPSNYENLRETPLCAEVRPGPQILDFNIP